MNNSNISNCLVWVLVPPLHL